MFSCDTSQLDHTDISVSDDTLITGDDVEDLGSEDADL